MEAAPRKRRRWPWLPVLGLVLAGSWFGLRALLHPERLTAFLLQQAEAASGLRFTLAQPADVAFWPDLHLVLQGLAIRAPHDEAPILSGHRVELALPWSALRGGDVHLRELRLVPMALDVDALMRWLESRADLGPPAPLRLPQLDAGLHVARSRVTWGEWVVADLDFTLDRLSAGEASTASVRGILGGPDLHQPFRFRTVFTPQQSQHTLRLDPLALAAYDETRAEPWLEANGRMSLDAPRRLLAGFDLRLPQWQAEWPALPLPEAADDARVTLRIDYDGTPQGEGKLDLRVMRGGHRIEGSLRAGALGAWWTSPQRSLLPPLQGSLGAPQLQFPGIELHGVRLRIDDGAPAAGNATTAPTDAGR